MNITTIGVDLAKSVFHVHGVDERGKTVLRKALKRAEVMSFFAKLVPCLIGMEACGSAHFWARKLSELGHTVKLMAPQFVKSYVKTNRNDARDAEAICEAVARPNMRFVAIKTVEQQALADTGLHAQRWSRERTIAWMVETTGQPREGIMSEVDRYCVVPGQACGYKVGQQGILSLRDKAKKALGGRFDLRGFNDAVVAAGNVPMTVLARVIDGYIAHSKG
ncbi:MAG: family transposase [Gammaproteobacteria bacterium]|nr:family transposase [Gammaproteobacteria bacterium]